MILPTVPQTTPLTTPDRSLANTNPNSRSEDGGFAMFWATDMPVQNPWPPVQNLLVEAPADPSVVENSESETAAAQMVSGDEAEADFGDFALPLGSVQPGDGDTEADVARAVAVEEPHTQLPDQASVQRVDIELEPAAVPVVAADESRMIPSGSARSSMTFQPGAVASTVEPMAQQAPAARLLPRGDTLASLPLASIADQAENPVAKQPTASPVDMQVPRSAAQALPDQPQTGAVQYAVTQASELGQTPSTARLPGALLAMMPLRDQIAASQFPAAENPFDDRSSPSLTSLPQPSDIAKVTALPLAPRPSAFDPAARLSLRGGTSDLSEIENVADRSTESRPQTQVAAPPLIAPATLAQVVQSTAVPMFQVLGSALTQQDDAAELDSALSPLHATSPSGSPIASTAAPYQMMARPNHPPVTHQLTEAFMRSEGGRTEIALNPEELGRVRFAMVTTDVGMTLAITTERPETADLIRRNLEDLAREFRQMGFENLSFSFEDAPQDQQSESASGRETLNASPEESPVTPEPVFMKRLRSGLDLKL